MRLTYSKNMLNEEIFLHVLRSVIAILFFIISYFVFEYFNKKPLGMQTIFDQMIKDLIYLLILMFIVSWFM